MAQYNTHYQKRNYFGKPYKELIDYLTTFDRALKVLDLGCGQGRDVLALGRLGFDVTGLDLSQVGIEQLNEIAQKESLPVVGYVGNYKEYEEIDAFDIILMNSMFHFYKNDVLEESKEIHRIFQEMKYGAVLILIIQKSAYRVQHIKHLMQQSSISLFIDIEESFIYQEFQSEFHMISIVKKLTNN